MAAEISERDKQLARELWQLVEKDYAAVGNILFRELFTAYPDYIKYFEKMKASPEQDIFESARFKKHMVSALFPSIALLLKNLDDPEKLAEQLKDIGVNHKKRNLHRAQFEALHKIIIDTFKKTLPEQFTSEVESAWNKILGVAFDKISSHLDNQC
ncbi:cytoglobin-2-like [Macrosteles quadrilineatus]|uniref:cytoglobin-2-like n=1 Tax=Macrosteles quadrilineatus TaxID=74068 RepID=UPI0023E27F99|nr:cytoglobin-2-like [Macrosteles quadrilineatus]